MQRYYNKSNKLLGASEVEKAYQSQLERFLNERKIIHKEGQLVLNANIHFYLSCYYVTMLACYYRIMALLNVLRGLF